MNTTPQEPAAAEATPAARRSNDHSIYKPNSRGSGGVMRFGLNRAKAAVFLEAAPQSGEKSFDWDAKITMKWGLGDLGPAIAVLQGRQESAKLFHQSEKSNSAFEIVHRTDPDRAPFLATVSRQESADKSVRKVTIPLSLGEAVVLEAVLRAGVARLVGW